MRIWAPLAVAVLAAAGWVACWHEVKELRRQTSFAPAQQAADDAEPDPSLPEPVRAANDGFATARVALAAAETAAKGIERLKNLLLEREHEISDARDVAERLDIPDGTPEMDAAIAVATGDIDRQIVDLAGPAAAAELGLPQARVPATVQPVPAYVPAPAPTPVVYAPSPSPNVVVVPEITVVNLQAPAPQAQYADYSETQPAVAPAYYGAVGGGIGLSVGGRGLRRGRGVNRSAASVISSPNFIASAGIPLKGSPLGQIVATNPLLLIRERTGHR